MKKYLNSRGETITFDVLSGGEIVCLARDGVPMAYGDEDLELLDYYGQAYDH